MVPQLTYTVGVHTDPALLKPPEIGVFGRASNRKLLFALFSDRLELMNVTCEKLSQ